MSSYNEQALLDSGWISKKGHGGIQWLDPVRGAWMGESCAMMRVRERASLKEVQLASYDTKRSIDPDSMETFRADPDYSDFVLERAARSGNGEDYSKMDEKSVKASKVADIIKDIEPGPWFNEKLDIPHDFVLGRVVPSGNGEDYLKPCPRNEMVDAAVLANIKAKLVKLINAYVEIDRMRDDLPDPHDELVGGCLLIMIEATAKNIMDIISYR